MGFQGGGSGWGFRVGGSRFHLKPRWRPDAALVALFEVRCDPERHLGGGGRAEGLCGLLRGRGRVEREREIEMGRER